MLWLENQMLTWLMKLVEGGERGGGGEKTRKKVSLISSLIALFNALFPCCKLVDYLILLLKN